MQLNQTLYYLRQYKEYNKAGMVPDVTCDSCDIPYVPKVDDDDVMLWCYQCDYEFTPGAGLVNEMIKYVREIEG